MSETATDQRPDERRPRSKTGCLLMTLFAVVFLSCAGLITSFFVSSGLERSKETTYITGPLKSDGRQVDYFAAIEQEIYPEGMATEDNGYRLIVEHLGCPPQSKPWQFEQVCRTLGLRASFVRPDMTYEEPGEFIARYVKSAQYDPAVIARLAPEEPQGAPAIEAIPTDDDVSAEQESQDVSTEEGSSADEEESAAGDENNEGNEAGTAAAENAYDDAADQGPSGYAATAYTPEPEVVLERRLGSPWTFDELPMMEQWLEDNSPALDLVGEAVRKPAFHIPIVRQNEDYPLYMTLLPDAQATRSFARGLSARAYYRIAMGDLDGAIDDIITCKRLGRHLGHGATLVDMLVGIALEGISDAIGIAGALDHPPTKEQLKRFVAELDDLPPRDEFKRKMRFERFSGLDMVQSMAQGRVDDDLGDFMGGDGALQYVGRFGFDWNIVARRLNAHYDALIDHGIEPSHPTISGRLVYSRAARSELIADTFASLLIPATRAAEEAIRRSECVDNMKRITLAMLLYACDHDGALPPAFTVDDEGDRLHTWRVLLLPYLGQQALYDKICLDEPWDSKHNRKFHAADVPFYQCPSAELAPGETTYSVIVGRKAAFDESGGGKRLAEFGPKSAAMILVVERKTDACWMDPTFNLSEAVAREGINAEIHPVTGGPVSPSGIGSRHPGGANFGHRSAAVRFLSDILDPEVLQGLIDGTSEELP